jgi:hypothetical protein
MADLPKGFYKGPDGKERFWDGKEWFTSSSNGEIPERAASKGRSNPKKYTSRIRVLLLAALVVIGVIGAGSWVIVSSQNATQPVPGTDDGVIDDQERADIIAQNQAIADENAISNREQAVDQLENDIKKLAKKQAEEGVINGPVLSVQCTPTGSYSLSDLEIRSMPFECFVANEDLGDGTFSGVDYHALANWDNGTFTYGLGKR